MQNSVLIVDDEPGIRDSVRAVLEDEGFEVETAASGEACLDLAQKNNYACILLDIWLGKGIDGLDTLKKLRDEGNDSAVVMISGHVGASPSFSQSDGDRNGRRDARGISTSAADYSVFHKTNVLSEILGSTHLL